MKSQGLCETTLTERFEVKDCKCPTYTENLGPCVTFEEGANGRCAYCDHEKACCDRTRDAVQKEMLV